MVNHETSWRLLDFNTPDPKMSLAASEAVFRCRRVGLSKNTLFLWRTAEPIVLFYSGSSHEVFTDSAGERKVESLRAQTVDGNSFFSDAGNMNFSISLDTQILKLGSKSDYRPLFSEYEFLLDGIAAGIRRLGVEARVETCGIYTPSGQELVAVQHAWLSDVLLLQGTIYVNSAVENLKPAFTKPLTTLSNELKKTILPDDVTDIVAQEFGSKLGATFERKRLTDPEQKLASKLYRTKYGTERWHIEGKAPFLALTGEKLVALYVANPPTSKCRQLITMVKRAAQHMDDVKIAVWRRGLGGEQQPMEAMPPVIANLSKANILPAVIIDGEVKFALEAPLETDLKEAIQHPENFPDILESLSKGGTWF